MATKTKKAAAPKLNIQHSYITLKLPTGNFTTSYSGAKASGQLAKMPGAFQALDRYVQTAGKTKSFGEAMNDLLDPALLDKLVPGWDKPIVADTLETKLPSNQGCSRRNTQGPTKLEARRENTPTSWFLAKQAA